mmetsp:Transcript_1786/g.4126  ORF Transcript_1786/g.4126 Transcript_1786/m.4126 type:complete len:223 (+) Transcript_1786:217-885(+)
MMAPGRRSKFFSTILVRSASVLPSLTVPYVSTNTDNGWETPIAYESCTNARLQSPAETNDLATHRAAYAADRSTFVVSLPLKAPPPCAPHPPYVSTMIFRPVKPASPCGPPITNRPDGLRWYTVLSSRYFSGMTGLMTCSMRSELICSVLTSSECWHEMTTVWTRTGTGTPSSSLYSHVTCVLASGRTQSHVPFLRTSVIFEPNCVASMCVSGIIVSVSSVA